MGRIRHGDQRHWHGRVGAGHLDDRRIAYEAKAMASVPMPGAGPTPAPLPPGRNLEVGSFWPIAFGTWMGERLFIDRGRDWIDLTFARRIGGYCEGMRSRPVEFDVDCAWPLAAVRSRWIGHLTTMIAIAAPSSEAASTRRLLQAPRARRTARFVVTVGDMVVDVRTIEADAFPWQKLDRLAAYAQDYRLASTRECLAWRDARRMMASTPDSARSMRSTGLKCEVP